MPSMSFVSSLSKRILFIVLSCSLLLISDFINTDLTGVSLLNPVTYDATGTARSVWTSMGREFALDHEVDSVAVRAQIKMWLADKERLNHILESAAPYIYFIYQETQDQGLPAEIALIPVIESEFNPYDRSNRGATGLWQLMPQTAHELGVNVRSGYDGRRNVVSSTRAALFYFKDLGEMFRGNWLLAIAAYNCGQIKVAHATKRAGSDNFWNLHLPKETELYVPRLLAVAEIIKNPKKYGVVLPTVDNKPYFKEVTIDKTTNLNQLAETSGSDLKTVKKLNPDYKQVVTPHLSHNKVLLPVEAKQPIKKVQSPPKKPPIKRAVAAPLHKAQHTTLVRAR